MKECEAERLIRELEMRAEEIRNRIRHYTEKAVYWRNEANAHKQTMNELEKSIETDSASAIVATEKRDFRVKAITEIRARNSSEQFAVFNELFEEAQKFYQEAEKEKMASIADLRKIQREIDNLRCV